MTTDFSCNFLNSLQLVTQMSGFLQEILYQNFNLKLCIDRISVLLTETNINTIHYNMCIYCKQLEQTDYF